MRTLVKVRWNFFDLIAAGVVQHAELVHCIFSLGSSYSALMIFIYNTKILLPLTFDEQTDKKRYASTGNRTHDQDWFT